MTSSIQSRLGTAPEEGCKAPVKVVANTPVTLSGEQTINSVAVVAGDRVLVNGQVDLAENGIYDVSTTAWSYAKDWNKTNDVIAGMLVPSSETTELYQLKPFTGTYTAGVTEVSFQTGVIASKQYENQLGSQAVAKVFTLTGLTYIVGANNLTIERNGQVLILGKHYTETSSTTVTITTTVLDTDDFVFRSDEAVTLISTTTSSVSHVDNGITHNLSNYLNRKERNAKDFNVIGDGVADDTTALNQMAVTLASSYPNGVVLNMIGTFLISGSVVFTSPVIIRGGGKVKAAGIGNVPMLWLQADDSSVDDLEVEGNDIVGTYPTANVSNAGILIGPTVSGFVQRARIGSNVRVSKVSGVAIQLDHCKNSRVDSPDIKDCAYAGIMYLSCVDCSIGSPTIENIQREGGTLGTNAYGITLTRPSTSDYVNDPQCTNIHVGMPVIKNVPTWIGFDTHAGVNITTDFVRAYQCYKPFNIQYDDATQRTLPKTIKLNGHGSSSSTEANASTGVNVLGLSATEQVEDVELNVRLDNCGDITGSEKGAVILSFVKDVKGKCDLYNSRRNGLTITGTNEDVDLTVDQHGSNYGAGTAFYCRVVDASLQINVRIRGDWKSNTDSAGTVITQAADTGIFYTNAKSTALGIWFDKVRMVLASGTTYIDNGTATNQYDDLGWTVEQEKMIKAGVVLTGGAQFDTSIGSLSSEFRRLPLDTLSLAPEWSLYNQVATVLGYGIRTFTNDTSPAAYKFDGTNTGAVTINIAGTQNGLFFVN